VEQQQLVPTRLAGNANSQLICFVFICSSIEHALIFVYLTQDYLLHVFTRAHFGSLLVSTTFDLDEVLLFYKDCLYKTNGGSDLW
jgi:hypothetical protein